MHKLYVYIVKNNPEKDMFLHCTSMNIVEESLPHVLFAMHLYSCDVSDVQQLSYDDLTTFNILPKNS